MLKIKCSSCGKELMRPGAILLSPPKQEGKVLRVSKFHICIKCYRTKIFY